LLPFKFIVEGAPLSVQTKSKSKQKRRQRFRHKARTAWGNNSPVNQPVRVVLTFIYMYDNIDIDNIIKPILDDLEDIVYTNDKLIRDIYARKRDLRLIKLQGLSSIMLERIVLDETFVHILVENAPDQTRL
jgi:Holliday junction resolvase RusA-like endonuclease